MSDESDNGDGYRYACAFAVRDMKERLRFDDAKRELAKVAPETAAIVEGWERRWRPSDPR